MTSPEKATGLISLMMKLGVVFLVIGIILQVTVLVQEFSQFAPLQNEYWIISKAERDAASSGSELNQKLATIKNFPSRLMTFKLVGVGSILTGIFLLLAGILVALKMMPVKLAIMLGKKPKAKKKLRRR